MTKDNDIATLENVKQTLQPLYDLTDALASEKRITLSSLTTVLEHISEILTEQAEDNLLIRQMKQKMRDNFSLEVRYTERVKQISSFLDPRFKGNFGKNLDDTLEACVEEAVKLAEAVSEHPQAEREGNEAGEGCSSFTTPKRKDKGLPGLLQQITSSRQNKAISENSHVCVSDEVQAEIRM